MEIRQDFKSAELQLNRLALYAKNFSDYNHGDWSGLKNNEDFHRVYDYEQQTQRALAKVYEVGRDLAVTMSQRLASFNYSEDYPTLVSYIDSFSGGSLDKISDLKLISQCAKETCTQLKSPPWAVQQMILLFDRQISLLESARMTIESLRFTDVYKFEVGATTSAGDASSYIKVLESIHATGQMFERHPSTYSGKGEEALRDHIIVTLSGLTSLSTTGETFNKKGKTDILVRAFGANVYVGECKFWGGPSAFLKTIDQLFGYLTWRDCNAGLIIFVERADFSGAITAMKNTIVTHPYYLKTVDHRDETWHNYQFAFAGDSGRVINLAVMLYNLQ